VGGGAISGCPHVLFDRTGTILSVHNPSSTFCLVY